MLRLIVFGGVGVRLEGAAAERGEPALARRSLALLALLAAAPESGISRDSLLAYLWPESDEGRARNALRQALYGLRHELDQSELVTGGVTLRLNPEIISSDLREFDSARAAGDLARAVGWYGGPFLEGFHLGGVPEFERWVERLRAEYAGRAAAAFETLGRQARQRGEAAASAEWWRRLALLDPLDSRVAMELMASLAAAGNAAGALRHGQEHEALLRAELGAAPDPAIVELMERLRNGNSGAIGAVPAGSSSPSRSAPFVPAVVPAARGAAAPAGAAPTVGGPEANGQEPAGSPVPGERFRDRLERELADRYVLDGPAEVGRDGRVRLMPARDRRHERPVTIKVLHPALASQIDVERFVREIRLTGRLLHPHLLPLLDSGEVGGRPWYAVPRHEGESLRARLARERRLPTEEAVRLTRELADALEHAHSHGIVHRDVTPENIFLTGGHALLTNLGIARAIDTAAGAGLTDTGVLLGTPAYMSPEQAAGERTVDGRSDVYSLALVLFEMVTGEPLFSGPTPQAIMAKRAAEPVPSANRLGDLTPELVPPMRIALSRSVERRYSSAAAFLAALEHASASSLHGAWRWLSWLRLGRR